MKKNTLDPIRSKYIAGPGRIRDLDACDVSGKVRVLRVEAVVPENVEADTIILGELPGGHSLFLGHQSLIEVSEVPTKGKSTTTFSIGLGSYFEPMGLKVDSCKNSLVKDKELKKAQTLLGNTETAKLKCVAATEITMTTSVPLKAGTVVRGFLAYSHD
jgi:hypothetical protein